MQKTREAESVMEASRRLKMSTPEQERTPPSQVVVMEFQPPRFVIEMWRDWKSEWAVLEYATDLKTAARRAEMLTRKEDAATRIIDRRPE